MSEPSLIGEWVPAVVVKPKSTNRTVGSKKGDFPLDAVIYYVQRTAVLNKVPFCSTGATFGSLIIRPQCIAAVTSIKIDQNDDTQWLYDPF